MADRLKLSEILDDRPVKFTIELSASVHRDLIAYGVVLGRETGKLVEVAKLIPAMLARSWQQIEPSRGLVEKK
jgi:hypothetical protein